MDMTVETLQLLSLAGYVLSGIFLVLALVLFFVLKIPAVVGEMTGFAARKAIAEIRRQNEQSGDRVYKAGPRSAFRKEAAANMRPAGRLAGESAGSGQSAATEKLMKPLLSESCQGAEKETCRMTAPECAFSQAAVSVAGNEITIVLPGQQAADQPAAVPGQTQPAASADESFRVEEEISFMESRELIE